MAASVAKKPFNDPDWIFETKLDGYRGNRGYRFNWQSSDLVSQSFTA